MCKMCSLDFLVHRHIKQVSYILLENFTHTVRISTVIHILYLQRVLAKHFDWEGCLGSCSEGLLTYHKLIMSTRDTQIANTFELIYLIFNILKPISFTKFFTFNSSQNNVIYSLDYTLHFYNVPTKLRYLHLNHLFVSLNAL